VKEVKKEEVVLDGGWTPEEVAHLTKGIVRFPPGTTQRWKCIADFVGSRT